MRGMSQAVVEDGGLNGLADTVRMRAFGTGEFVDQALGAKVW